MLGRKIKIFFQICQAIWAISYSLLESQKSTKAAALVALVVMTPLNMDHLGITKTKKCLIQEFKMIKMIENYDITI